MKRLFILMLLAHMPVSAIVMQQKPCPTTNTTINQALIQSFANNRPQTNLDQIGKTQYLLKYMGDFFKTFDQVLKESSDQQQINKTFYQSYLQFLTLNTQRIAMGQENFEKYTQKNNLPSLQSVTTKNEEIFKQFTKVDQQAFAAAQMSTALLCPPNGSLTPEATSFLQLIIDQLSGPKAIQAIPLNTTSQLLGGN